MDVKVLQFRNKKLAERLEQRQVCEDELRERIEKLEKRQATDDATLHLVNRFWAQVTHLGAPGHGWDSPGGGDTKKNGVKIGKNGDFGIKNSPGHTWAWVTLTWAHLGTGGTHLGQVTPKKTGLK
ncbi:hypothetical protein TURU_095044 [Turdus rufiventris]|nr:hypothetical protein TURU_095044 [Turdus rufiventris]